MANFNYEAGEEQEATFDVIPAGEYLAVIDESDYKPNKKNTGMLLTLRYNIIDGEHKGRVIFENLSIQHENAQAQAIAQRALNSVCSATGILTFKDTAQLHNIPVKIDVRVKDDPSYGPRNEIKKHTPAGTGSPKKGASTDNPGANTAPTKQPWKK